MKVIIGLIFLFIPFVAHASPAYDTRARKSLEAFAKDFAKKNQLEFLNQGIKFIANADEAIWTISLVSHQKLTLEQGRACATKLTYELLHKIHHDPLFAKYCEMEPRAGSTKLKDEYVGFRLAFWDENVDRPLYPYLAQIRLADGKLYYHFADPHTQALQEPIVESLESISLRN